MKKLLVVFSLFALLVSACGSEATPPAPLANPATGEVGEVVLNPNSVEAKAACNGQTNCVVTVNNSPTLEDEYKACVAEAEKAGFVQFSDLELEDNELEYAPCRPLDTSVSQADMYLVPAMTLAKLTPPKQDDVIMYGIVIGRFVLVAATAWITAQVAAGVFGGTVVMARHSNREHNPNIAGTKARANITTIITTITTSTCAASKQCRCGVMKAGEVIIKAAIWIADSSRMSLVAGDTPGYLAWYHIQQPGTPLKGPWGSSFDKTLENWEAFQPNEIERGKGWTWHPMECDDPNFPQPPTFLQAAQ